MGGDVVAGINRVRHRQPALRRRLRSTRSVARNLTEAAILTISPDGEIQTLAVVNLDDRPLEQRFPPQMLQRAARRRDRAS